MANPAMLQSHSIKPNLDEMESSRQLVKRGEWLRGSGSSHRPQTEHHIFHYQAILHTTHIFSTHLTDIRAFESPLPSPAGLFYSFLCSPLCRVTLEASL